MTTGIAGPSVAKGYWGRPEESRETFEARLADTGEGPYLRTGDLGFVHDGDVYSSSDGRQSHGVAARADLSCGRIDLWSGPPLAGPAPNPGTPGDCD